MTDLPTVPGPEPSTTPEGLELHKNGTITAFINERRFELRRPKAGEYRRLREALEVSQDELLTRTYEIRAQKSELTASPADLNEIPLDERLDSRKRNREFNSYIENSRSDWMREVFATLSTTPFDVERDDEPVWFTTDGAINQLLEHWQSVPSPRGVH